MGQTGSYTTKIEVNTALSIFTKWDTTKIKELMKICQHTLSDTFALRIQEFMFLIGRKTLSLPNARFIFNVIFDTDSNQLVDKFEILCGILLLSAVSSEEKVEFLYDIFDFNCKGFLVETEVVLLLRTVTNCADKIDSNMGAPPDYRIREIAHDSMSFALMNPGSLRKYELVQFAANYPTVRAFLESWRGHASQVLLASHQKWQDQSFPNLHTSICPSVAWLSLGLPPNDFIHWKRKERVASGCLLLFAHHEKYMKSTDRIAHSGVGCLANGILKQGLLADRWLMNGLACLIPDAIMLKFIFTLTGQENIGRYCIRLFEGRGWETIFIDDRIPCNPLDSPVFLSSSCENECWPMILEKGFAKKFGSYGHLGACGVRYDATETALRMLTGGHINKVPSSDYDWKSVPLEVAGKDGVEFILKLLKEGSLVSFGKSESRIFMYPKKKKKRDKYTSAKSTYPFGRLFPVLGIEIKKGYKFVVLRDAWGLVSDVTTEPDPFYGQCRLFQIPVEKITEEFDTMLVCRYPDSMKNFYYRESKKLIHIKPPVTPWLTEILHLPSRGLTDPARFLIRVSPSPPGGFLVKRSAEEAVEPTNDPVEVSFTVSSSNLWSESSDIVHPSPPRLYGRLFPTSSTLDYLQKSPPETPMIDLFDSTRIRYPPPVQTDFTEYLHLSTTNSITKTSVSQVVDAPPPPSLPSSSSSTTSPLSPQELSSSYNFTFCCERSWMSHSFILPPGEYILCVAIEEQKSSIPSSSSSPFSSSVSAAQMKKNKPTTQDPPPAPSASPAPVQTSASSASSPDNKDPLQGVWCQVSSIGKIGLHSLPVEEFEKFSVNDLNYFTNMKLHHSLPLPEVWPLMMDHQHEVSSKGLIQLLTQIRSDLNMVNVEFLDLKNKLSKNKLQNIPL